MTAARPPMLYDYYGFPPESYQITWPAPGEPALAARVRALLGAAGIDSAEDARRGFDHGTFVPLKLAYPDADVPTVQLSLRRGLDPQEHLAIGRALAPLRDEGRLHHRQRHDVSQPARLRRSARAPGLRGVRRLAARERGAAAGGRATAACSTGRWRPSARLAHPREEHLLPLMVIAGAAGADRGVVGYGAVAMGVRLSSYHFG